MASQQNCFGKGQMRRIDGLFFWHSWDITDPWTFSKLNNTNKSFQLRSLQWAVFCWWERNPKIPQKSWIQANHTLLCLWLASAFFFSISSSCVFFKPSNAHCCSDFSDSLSFSNSWERYRDRWSTKWVWTTGKNWQNHNFWTLIMTWTNTTVAQKKKYYMGQYFHLLLIWLYVDVR